MHFFLGVFIEKKKSHFGNHPSRKSLFPLNDSIPPKDLLFYLLNQKYALVALISTRKNFFSILFTTWKKVIYININIIWEFHFNFRIKFPNFSWKHKYCDMCISCNICENLYFNSLLQFLSHDLLATRRKRK